MLTCCAYALGRGALWGVLNCKVCLMVVSIIQNTLFVISSEVEKSVGYMAKKEFHTSGQLMEAIIYHDRCRES